MPLTHLEDEVPRRRWTGIVNSTAFLLMVSLVSAIATFAVLSASRREPAVEARQTAVDRKPPYPEPPPAEPASSTPAKPAPLVEGTPADDPPAAKPETPAPAVEKHAHEARGLHLRNSGSIVTLAVNQDALETLRKHPEQLPDLIRDGVLFTAKPGIAVKRMDEHGALLYVQILEGPMEGRTGWINRRQTDLGR